MQHIEEAGIHSGDCACVLPPYLLSDRAGRGDARVHPALRAGAGRGGAHQRAVRRLSGHGLRDRGQSARLAHRALRLQGHRACRSRASPRASWRARSWRTSGCRTRSRSTAWRSRRACFPFNKLPRPTRCSARRCAPPARRWASTTRFGMAFAKAQISAGTDLPLGGNVIITVNDHDKPTVTADRAAAASTWASASWPPAARRSTSARAACPASAVFKVNEGRPNMVDRIISRRGGAADQHAARQAEPVRRLRHAARGHQLQACRTSPRCPPPKPPPTPSSRCASRTRTVKSIQERTAGMAWVPAPVEPSVA